MSNDEISVDLTKCEFLSSVKICCQYLSKNQHENKGKVMK